METIIDTINQITGMCWAMIKMLGCSIGIYLLLRGLAVMLWDQAKEWGWRQ